MGSPSPWSTGTRLVSTSGDVLRDFTRLVSTWGDILWVALGYDYKSLFFGLLNGW